MNTAEYSANRLTVSMAYVTLPVVKKLASLIISSSIQVLGHEEPAIVLTVGYISYHGQRICQSTPDVQGTRIVRLVSIVYKRYSNFDCINYTKSIVYNIRNSFDKYR